MAVTPATAEAHGSDSIADLVDPEGGQIPRLGIVGVKIDGRVAALLPGLRSPYGVYVIARVDVVSGATSGLQVGDVIHEINGAAVASVDAVNQAMAALRRGDPVALLIEREGRLQYQAFEAD